MKPITVQIYELLHENLCKLKFALMERVYEFSY
jgi:hypothetical protein